MDYLYDGTFEGFLTCVYNHYYMQKAEGIFIEDEYQQSMTSTFKVLETDEIKAQKVYRALENTFTAYDMKRIYRVFLSGVEGGEMIILRYIVMGFKKGSDIWKLHSNVVVNDFHKIDFKVSREVHRMKGLVRFSVMKGGILYCVIEPDYDITELLAYHFSDRLGNQSFIIHDKKRGKAVIARNGAWFVSPFSGENLPDKDDDEESFAAMWKEYFETIAIKERKNSRCQKNFMPARYWKHLTELN